MSFNRQGLTSCIFSRFAWPSADGGRSPSTVCVFAMTPTGQKVSLRLTWLPSRSCVVFPTPSGFASNTRGYVSGVCTSKVARIPPPRSRCCILHRAATSAAAITPATNFHLVLHSVYKNPADAKHEQLQLLEALTLQRLDELNVDSLITVMFAFARSSYHPDGRIQHRMAAATEADMASFTPRQLEHAAWSLAHVGYRPSARWLDNFAQALQVNWDYFRPADLAVTLVEGASCGLTRLTRATLADQLPSALKTATAGSAATAPGTLAKLVWSAGHFSDGAPSGQQAAGALRTVRDGAPPDATTTAIATETEIAAAAALASSRVTSGRPASEGWVLPTLPEEALLAWWEDEGVVEAAEPSDLVLLLNGLARLGVRPASGWTARLLAAVMGSPAALAQLDARLLALLAWSSLKVADSPLRREWLEAFVQALRSLLRLAAVEEDAGSCGPDEDAGDRAGSTDHRQGGTSSGMSSSSISTNITFTSSREDDLGSGCGAGKVEEEEEEAGVAMSAAAAASARRAQPADVALALSSLAGLGTGLGGVGAGAGEVQKYWRTAGRWATLSQDDRLVMTLLGYSPGAGGQASGLSV